MTQTAIVERVSQFGIMIKGEWFNAYSTDSKVVIKELIKGDKVEFNFFDKNGKHKLNFLKKVESTRTYIPNPVSYIPNSKTITPTKEAKQILGDYICSICGSGYVDCKTKLLCEQNHYLKDIADTLRARM